MTSETDPTATDRCFIRSASEEGLSGRLLTNLFYGITLYCLLVTGQVTAQPQVAVGSTTCVLSTDGKVRCWGYGISGANGYGNTDTIGDDEVPAVAGDVNVGADVLQVSTGAHTCVLTTDNKVRCWGYGSGGQLGYGSTDNIGDDEVPADSGDVNVGADVVYLSSRSAHTCVVTTANTVRCWGAGDQGQLGYGSIHDIGDDEVPADSGDVNVGADVLQVSTGGFHTCVVTTANKVRCWGEGGGSGLGYLSLDAIGDNEVPADSGDVNVGADVVNVSAGGSHRCALTTGNAVRCWGAAHLGQLGYGNTDPIGDDEAPADAGDVNVGMDVLQVSAGDGHTCVVTTANTVRCWGQGSFGMLGYGNTENIGDDEVPADVGDVNVGEGVLQVAAGNRHTCVVTTSHTIRCWGWGNFGRLGYGNTDDIGDDEAPADAGDVIVFDSQLPVELATFDAIVERDRVDLSWSTASETNNAGFEVHHLFERSGQTFWDVLGYVEGAGSTNQTNRYTFEVGPVEPGRHLFRLKQIDLDGAFKFTEEVEALIEVPGSHFISDAYPNPFNPRSYFSVAVPTEQTVSVTMHDAAGRRVRTLFEGVLQANEQHTITIDGVGLASGVYLYRFKGKNFAESRMVTLQK